MNKKATKISIKWRSFKSIKWKVYWILTIIKITPNYSKFPCKRKNPFEAICSENDLAYFLILARNGPKMREMPTTWREKSFIKKGVLLTEIGFFKCQVQNLRAIEEGGLWYVKSVRLDISVGRAAHKFLHVALLKTWILQTHLKTIIDRNKKKISKVILGKINILYVYLWVFRPILGRFCSLILVLFCLFSSPFSVHFYAYFDSFLSGFLVHFLSITVYFRSILSAF